MNSNEKAFYAVKYVQSLCERKDKTITIYFDCRCISIWFEFLGRFQLPIFSITQPITWFEFSVKIYHLKKYEEFVDTHFITDEEKFCVSKHRKRSDRSEKKNPDP